MNRRKGPTSAAITALIVCTFAQAGCGMWTLDHSKSQNRYQMRPTWNKEVELGTRVEVGEWSQNAQGDFVASVKAERLCRNAEGGPVDVEVRGTEVYSSDNGIFYHMGPLIAAVGLPILIGGAIDGKSGIAAAGGLMTAGAASMVFIPAFASPDEGDERHFSYAKTFRKPFRWVDDPHSCSKPVDPVYASIEYGLLGTRDISWRRLDGAVAAKDGQLRVPAELIRSAHLWRYACETHSAVHWLRIAVHTTAEDSSERNTEVLALLDEALEPPWSTKRAGTTVGDLPQSYLFSVWRKPELLDELGPSASHKGTLTVKLPSKRPARTPQELAPLRSAATHNDAIAQQAVSCIRRSLHECGGGNAYGQSCGIAMLWTTDAQERARLHAAMTSYHEPSCRGVNKWRGMGVEHSCQLLVDYARTPSEVAKYEALLKSVQDSNRYARQQAQQEHEREQLAQEEAERAEQEAAERRKREWEEYKDREQADANAQMEAAARADDARRAREWRQFKEGLRATNERTGELLYDYQRQERAASPQPTPKLASQTPKAASQNSQATGSTAAQPSTNTPPPRQRVETAPPRAPSAPTQASEPAGPVVFWENKLEHKEKAWQMGDDDRYACTVAQNVGREMASKWCRARNHRPGEHRIQCASETRRSPRCLDSQSKYQTCIETHDAAEVQRERGLTLERYCEVATDLIEYCGGSVGKPKDGREFRAAVSVVPVCYHK